MAAHSQLEPAVSAPALDRLIDQIQTARSQKGALDIRGGGTKAFYGEPAEGVSLDVKPLTGISSYEPSELVVTVRAGTPLAELEEALANKGQYLPFEPPRYGSGGTVGGMVASGLSGPARAAVGSVRDHVLGATLINGQGHVLSFGGQVMKNVAGYDVCRLLAGSMGILGVICEVSIKVMPQPVATCTLRFEKDVASAIQQLNEWAGKPLPINASAWWEGMLVVRLSGNGAAVDAAQRKLGGETIERNLAASFWAGLRDHTDEFFIGAAKAVQGGATLWRLSVPQVAPPLNLPGEQLMEWGGAQRWLCTPLPAAQVREVAAAAKGHAVLFRGADKSGGAFAPLPEPQMRIHREMKAAFDPDGIFNRGRLYPEL
jgi:glycolate oxidase FAD binding subunit